MSSALDELKTRARVRLNSARREGMAGSLKLADCLHDAARAVGFAHWEHARHVLGGHATVGDDQGDFWHAPRTGILLNQWFAQHGAAVAVLGTDRSAYLLPYRRQCFIVQAPFIEALGLDADDALWSALGHDLVAGYGSPAWQALAAQRVRAPLETFAGR